MGKDFGNAVRYSAERMIYHQSFIKTTKNALATLLMSYLLDSITGEEELNEVFVRTMENIQIGTGMTRSEIRRARKILVDLNWIKYKVKDAPPKTYYSLGEGLHNWWKVRPTD